MAVRIDLTLDCASPTRLAEFWKLTLGYEDEDDGGEPGHHLVMADPEGNEFCAC